MFGLGSNLQGLGQQAQGARTADISNLYGMGQGQQATVPGTIRCS